MHTYQEGNGPQNTVCATKKKIINEDEKLTFRPMEKKKTLKKTPTIT